MEVIAICSGGQKTYQRHFSTKVGFRSGERCTVPCNAGWGGEQARKQASFNEKNLSD